MGKEAAPQDRSLVMALHDVCPATIGPCRRLAALVQGCLPGARLTLLIVPEYHGANRIDDASTFRRWVDGRLERGDELAMHGLRHLDEAASPWTPRAWIARRVMTAREAEFAAVTADEARMRITRGLALMRNCGWPVAGFVPPAWQISARAGATLGEFGFGYTSTRTSLYRLPDWTRCRAPALTFGSRSALRRWASIRWTRSLVARVQDLPLVRFALHPGDNSYDELVDCWRVFLALLAADRTVITKGEAIRMPAVAEPQSVLDGLESGLRHSRPANP